MVNFKIFFLFLVLLYDTVQAELSDERLCANLECTEPVSIAETLLRYNAPEKGMLSFLPSQKIKIFSKSAGKRTDLWGAEIDGKRGYIPKSHVREIKILKPKLEFLVPTENHADSTESSAPAKEEISPNSVTSPYEVVDGTTIYTEVPNINPAATPSHNNSTYNGVQQSENTQEENIIEPTLSIFPNPQAVYKNQNAEQTIDAAHKKEEIPIAAVADGKNPSEISENTNEPKIPEVDKVKNKNTEETDHIVSEVLNDHEEMTPGNVAETNEVVKINMEDEKPSNIPAVVEESQNDKITATEENKLSESNKDIEKNVIPKVEEESTIENVEKIDTNIEIKIEDKKVPDVKESLTNMPAAVEESNTEKITLTGSNKSPEVNKLELPEVVKDNKEVVPEYAEDELSKDKMHISEEDTDNSNEDDTNEDESVEVEEEDNEETSDSEKTFPDVSKNSRNVLDVFSSILTSANSAEPVEKNPPEVPSGAEQTPPVTESNHNSKENIIEEEKKLVEDVPNNDKTKEKQTETVDANQDIKTVEKETMEVKNAPKEDSDRLKDDLQYVPSTLSAILKPVVYNSPPGILEKVPESSTVESFTTDANVHFTTEMPSQEIPLPFTDDVTETTLVNEDQHSISQPELTNKDTNDDNIDTVNVVTEATRLFSQMYTSIFGSAEELTTETTPDQDVEKELTSNVESDVTDGNKEEHSKEGPSDKYMPNAENIMASDNSVINDMGTCERGEKSGICKYQSENDIPELVIDKKMIEYDWLLIDFPDNASRILMYLGLASISVLLFCLSYYFLEKKRIDGTLISKINSLEKKLLISSKENLLFQDELKQTKDRLVSIEDSSFGSDEMVTLLKQTIEEEKNTRTELEEQIANLEKELEAATEAGMEMNKMLSEIWSSQHGNENLMQNVENLQKQLIEQQTTINSINSTLGAKNTENELLQTELSVANDKIEQLQADLDKMVVNLLTVQEEKAKTEMDLEEQSKKLKEEFDNKIQLTNIEMNSLKEENIKLKQKCETIQRELELKHNEYSVLEESVSEVQAINSNKESLKALLDVSKVKAEVQQLRDEKHMLNKKLQTEKDSKLVLEKQIQIVMQEMKLLKDKFEEADKDKVEAQTRLDVLSSYFKEKETQMQKEISEHESLWVQKQGEATSTVERIKWIQEELQNYKSQNELLKKEILDQEVSLKSQISLLEKKAHDNWVLARQAERKLEDTRQEASQLRNRLTIVEKNINNSSQLDDGKLQNRLMESNGDIAVSPLHMGNVEASGSPPLLYPHRDHMTTSPPIPGLPPFMPPPPGVPFMPPPMPGVPPFMPPPPALFPGDHRPPPLGRMSSPPIHGRYSPDSRAYSPYDRDDSPPLSPTYADSDYRRGRSPPPPHGPRTFSPYSGKSRPQWDDMRDYRERPHQSRMKSRGHKGTGASSGSGNSNDSLDNSGRHSGRV